jgi:diadenosine tetraphosphate (Ap4A) HIT family hydrolase
VMGSARTVAAAMISTLSAQGSFVAMNNVVSQSVPHVHVHVVPRTKGDGLRGFFWPRTRYATRTRWRSTRSGYAPDSARRPPERTLDGARRPLPHLLLPRRSADMRAVGSGQEMRKFRSTKCMMPPCR